MRFRTPKHPSTVCCPASCSTTCPPAEKDKMLREIRRVLKPGGEFHMLDFEGPERGAHSVLRRSLHSADRLKANSESRVLQFLREAAFSESKTVGHREMFFGHIAYYQAIAKVTRA